MGNTQKRHSRQDQNANKEKVKTLKNSGETVKRDVNDQSRDEQRRKAGKEGGTKRGEGDRNGSDH